MSVSSVDSPASTTSPQMLSCELLGVEPGIRLVRGAFGHDCATCRILNRMTRPVPTRFTDEELALIDQLVDHGVADSRSAVIRRGVHHLADSVHRAQVGEAIAASYRASPQTPEDNDLAMANANAMTEAEPW